MNIWDWLYPKSCFICQLPSESNLCSDCSPELPWLSKICLSCAEPLPQEDLEICGECIITSPPIDLLVVLFRYEPPISSLITGLKFRNQLFYASLLGKLLAIAVHARYEAIDSPLPFCMIPTPLSKRRLRQRGYNQAMEIARPVKKHLHIPIDHISLKRVKETLPQTLLSRQQRQANIKKAFALKRPLHHQHIAIIDDVATTFSTLFEIAHVLKKQGATRVDAWCIAKANP